MYTAAYNKLHTYIQDPANYDSSDISDEKSENSAEMYIFAIPSTIPIFMMTIPISLIQEKSELS